MTRNSPRAIERDIEATRARIDHTIDELEDKLSPAQMIGQILSFTKAGGGEFAGSLASAAKNHPLPMTLLSIGAGWLMMSDRGHKRGDGRGEESYRSESYGRDGEGYQGEGRHEGPLDRAQDKVKEAAERAQAKVHEAAERTKATMHEAVDRTKSTMHEAVDRTQSTVHEAMDRTQAKAHDMRDRLDEVKESALSAAEENIAHLRSAAEQLLEQNPLAAGALMVAVGALIGGSLPLTERERELFGQSGEKVREVTTKVVERGTEAVRDIAQAAMEEGKHSIEELAQQVEGQGQQGGQQGQERSPAHV